MSSSRRLPTRDHDLRMHLGVIIVAIQMMSRPPVTPLSADQQELLEIIKRASKAMETLLEQSPSVAERKS